MLPHFQWVPLVSDIFITTLQGEQGRSAMWLESTINREKRDTHREGKKSLPFFVLFLLFYNLCTGEEDGYKQLEGFFFSFFFFIKPKCV